MYMSRCKEKKRQKCHTCWWNKKWHKKKKCGREPSGGRVGGFVGGRRRPWDAFIFPPQPNHPRLKILFLRFLKFLHSFVLLHFQHDQTAPALKIFYQFSFWREKSYFNSFHYKFVNLTEGASLIHLWTFQFHKTRKNISLDVCVEVSYFDNYVTCFDNECQWLFNMYSANHATSLFSLGHPGFAIWWQYRLESFQISDNRI